MNSSLSNSAGDPLELRNDLIRHYFFRSYTYEEIQMILQVRHGIIISLRQLHRILQTLGLRRHSRVQRDIVRQHELEGSGSSLGYRSMTRRLLATHGLSVPRLLVAKLLRELDPNGVSMRAMHQFSRRVYTNKGPNYLIHIDGYDKLKPFGFPIHGAICVPRCVRIDNGTENVMIEAIQMAFRWDHSDEMAAEKSVIRGSSHSNQRIERWWRSNKQGGCQFWIDLFKDLVDSGNLSTSTELHVECMRFCFIDVLQKELDRIKIEWNQHPIRNCRSESPSGKPDIMFHLPCVYDTVDYKTEVSQEDINAVQQYCQTESAYSCTEENYAIFTRCMRELGRSTPSTANEALEQYPILKNLVNQQ